MIILQVAKIGIEPSKPYSGKLIVRMPSNLHGMVAMAAANTGTTINEELKE